MSTAMDHYTAIRHGTLAFMDGLFPHHYVKRKNPCSRHSVQTSIIVHYKAQMYEAFKQVRVNETDRNILASCSI